MWSNLERSYEIVVNLFNLSNLIFITTLALLISVLQCIIEQTLSLFLFFFNTRAKWNDTKNVFGGLEIIPRMSLRLVHTIKKLVVLYITSLFRYINVALLIYHFFSFNKDWSNNNWQHSKIVVWYITFLNKNWRNSNHLINNEMKMINFMG
jgi:hypothetical protein